MSVIIVEPGAFRTEFLGRSIGVARTRIAAYDATSGQARDYRETNSESRLVIRSAVSKL
jgi:hypothetical protein